MKLLKSFYNKIPYTKEQKYNIEKEIFDDMKINEKVKEKEINMSHVINRKELIFNEKNYNKPQNIFFIKISNEVTLFGRKLLSELRQQNLIPSINCSLISENMIIGLLKSYKVNDLDIIIKYYPLLDEEKKYIFNQIKKDRLLDIYHPFKYYDYNTKKESDSPKDGWKILKNTTKDLFNGEAHLRKYTLQFLNNINITDKMVFFDPACSTGDFLYSIKNKYPNIITIGQDLGKEMVDCAKKKLDIVYLGDSINTKVKDDSVDFLFLRFLNFRVVTTEKSVKLYKYLIKKVKIGGYIICFGHTPILLSYKDLSNEGYKILQCNGYSKDYNSIFQYYIIRREK